MTRLLFHKLGNTLVPVDDQGWALMSKLKHRQEVTVEVVRARNGRQHRLFWALVGIVYENQTKYATRQQVADAIKCAIGYCDEVEGYKGAMIQRPRSIAFANMKQDEFTEFLDKAIQFVCGRIIPFTEGDLRSELEQMVGIAA